MTLDIHELARTLAKSSDLKAGMAAFCRCLQKSFPLDHFLLSLYDDKKGTLSFKAFSSHDRTLLLDETIRLTPAARAEAKREIQSKTTLYDSREKNA
ncbi:MAG: hypothetical protein R3356_10115, partial [Eudoraea sp.]|nr:hypothetical protein [Eudoraea sp.]